MLIPNFKGDLQERLEKLNRILSGKSEITLIGSSFGGLMATIFCIENSSRVDRLILLAPAINLIKLSEVSKRKINVPVTIYHGKSDEVIPLKDVEPIAAKTFSNLDFHKVDDDHFLHRTFKTIDWETLLS